MIELGLGFKSPYSHFRAKLVSYGYNFIFKLPEKYIYFKESIFFSQIEQLSLNNETILNSYVSTTLTRQSPAYFMSKYYCEYTSYSQSA